MLPTICLILAGTLIAQDYNQPGEEKDARVARISFTEGTVTIRRAGEEEWEDVVRDLAVVEGDEIAAGADGRFEIQFDNDTHARVASDSVLKIESLSEEGIAVSLASGRLNLTTRKFDANKTFLEIDAPGTTIAVLRTGRYRVDADGGEVRVGVSSDGEARVYSSNAGFTLKSGRSASVFLEGDNAGEWETRDYAGIEDDFDKWTFDRDDEFAKRLATANYGEYYDDSLYGAEDLNTYGSWVHNTAYGYVWRPSSHSLSNYSNWTPYRYGSWRWIPAYGWTWVNDEPWGWTTYHHGRWFWSGGNWYWSPFGANRSYANHWRPALVYVTTVGNSICWYPLPYNSPYYNYNARYLFDRRRISREAANPATTPPSTQTTVSTTINRSRSTVGGRIIPAGNIPDSAVMAVDAEQFGRGRRGIVRANPAVARAVLTASTQTDGEPVLPIFRRTGGRISTQTSVQPTTTQIPSRANIGAARRSTGRPLDRELRDTRFFPIRRPAAGGTVDMPITPLPAASEKTTTPPTRSRDVDVKETSPIVRPRNETPTSLPRSRTRRETPDATTPPTRSRDMDVKETPPIVRPRNETRTKETPPIVRPRNETPTYVPDTRTPVTRRESPDSTTGAAPARPETFRPRREPFTSVPRRAEPTRPVYSPPVRRTETPRSSPPPQRPSRSAPPQRSQPTAPPRSNGNSSSGQTRSALPMRSNPVRPAPPSARKTRPD